MRSAHLRRSSGQLAGCLFASGRAARSHYGEGRKMLLVKTDNSPASGGEEYAHTTKATRLRVFIVSDVRLLRDGLALSLSQQPSLNVSGSADLTVAPTQIAAVHPDVMLLDVGG